MYEVLVSDEADADLDRIIRHIAVNLPNTPLMIKQGQVPLIKQGQSTL